MIDHNGLFVSDYRKSLEFYSRALAPFGYKFMVEIDPAFAASSPNDPPRAAEYVLANPLGGFGSPTLANVGRKPPFWITQGRPGTVSPVVCSFVCPDKSVVDAFFKAAVEAGATVSAPPGERKVFGGQCYSAAILDFDRNEIEAMAWL